MSTYRRRGHYRRGPNGQRVWVSSHDVTRSGGSKYSYTQPPQRRRPSMTTIPTAPGPRQQTPKWAEPNARCPVCGAAVYFYKNEAGSRVYFDEIGPPWPKHPCLDIPFFTRPDPAFEGPCEEPKPLSPKSVSVRASGASQLRSATQPSGGSKTGYRAFIVQDSESGEKRTILHVQELFGSQPVQLWDVEGKITPEPGQLVFVSDMDVSYFDISEMSIIQLPSGCIKTMSHGDTSPSRRSGSGCGWLLLIFFVPILMWLMFGFWGTRDHSFMSVIGGAVISLITAFGLLLGFILLAPQPENARDRQSVPESRNT